MFVAFNSTKRTQKTNIYTAMKASDTQEIGRICDQAYEMILDGAVLDGMGRLHSELNEVRGSREESRLSAGEIIEHRITPLIHQYPLTNMHSRNHVAMPAMPSCSIRPVKVA